MYLNCHSYYSMRYGTMPVETLVEQAAGMAVPALALTDHGVMHGAVEFFRNCKKAGVKPIIGVEAYMTPYGRKMTDTDPNKNKVRHHLLLLAQNMTGYKNLIKICSDAQLQGFYYKPRIDADYLAAHAEGLICTTGCMAAEIPYLLNPEDGRPPHGQHHVPDLLQVAAAVDLRRFQQLVGVEHEHAALAGPAQEVAGAADSLAWRLQRMNEWRPQAEEGHWGLNDDGQSTFSATHEIFQWMLDPDGDPATGRAKQMAGHALGRADHELPGVVTEHRLDRHRFIKIIEWC